MLTVSVIQRGKYGKRLTKTMSTITPFTIKTAEVPEVLPDLIEDAGQIVDELEKRDIFNCDLLITYSLHPDVTSTIVDLAAMSGVKAIIIPAAAFRCDVMHDRRIAKKYNIDLRIDDVCCSIGPGESKVINEFTAYIGKPELDITTENGLIKDVKVLRCAPCGSTLYGAEEIIGLKEEEAPSAIGLAIQHYPCRAVRGTKDGIHTSARIHKEAVEKALDCWRTRLLAHSIACAIEN